MLSTDSAWPETMNAIICHSDQKIINSVYEHTDFLRLNSNCSDHDECYIVELNTASAMLADSTNYFIANMHR